MSLLPTDDPGPKQAVLDGHRSTTSGPGLDQWHQVASQTTILADKASGRARSLLSEMRLEVSILAEQVAQGAHLGGAWSTARDSLTLCKHPIIRSALR